MIEYLPEHEPLVVAWYYELQRDPREFEQLFMAPLRSLTELLHWAKHQVKFIFASDGTIWAAGWFEPIGSSAFYGCWIRKDRRGTPSSYAFVRRCHREGLQRFEELIGITCQPELEKVHLALGYEKMPTELHLFDKRKTWVYILNKDGLKRKHERRNRRDDALQPDPLDPFDQREDGADRHDGLALDSGTDLVREGGQGGELVRDQRMHAHLTASERNASGLHAQDDHAVGRSDRSSKRGRSRQSKSESTARVRRVKQSKSQAAERQGPKRILL